MKSGGDTLDFEIAGIDLPLEDLHDSEAAQLLLLHPFDTSTIDSELLFLHFVPDEDNNREQEVKRM